LAYTIELIGAGAAAKRVQLEVAIDVEPFMARERDIVRMLRNLLENSRPQGKRIVSRTA
jgi:hypothetical protein